MAAVLIAALGAVPVAATYLVDAVSFAGTLAEDAARLERGGIDAGAVADRFEKRAREQLASHAELLALARYQLRRGKLEPAMANLKEALAKRPNEPRAMVNLGNVMFAKEDLPGAQAMYQAAATADPTLVAPHLNLFKLHRWRAQLPGADVLELDRARAAQSAAAAIDPRLAAQAQGADQSLQLNRLLVSPGLARADLLALASAEDRSMRVGSQLTAELLGAVEQPIASIYPALLAGLLVALGYARSAVGGSKPCTRCGRAVCSRCDPELGFLSDMCGQCVNVFARKGVVAPALKVRKQIEVARHQGRMDKLSYGLGLLCSGAGHLFSGLPVRGAIYAFFFLFAVVMFFLRDGVLRAPYGGLPEPLLLVPLGALFVCVHLLSLRGLYKRQSQ